MHIESQECTLFSAKSGIIIAANYYHISGLWEEEVGALPPWEVLLSHKFHVATALVRHQVCHLAVGEVRREFRAQWAPISKGQACKLSESTAITANH